MKVVLKCFPLCFYTQANEDLLELMGIFDRYKFDAQQLIVF